MKPFTKQSVNLQKKEVKSIATIVARDWAIVNGEFIILTAEEKKWRAQHAR